MPSGSDEIHRRMGKTHISDGILGRHVGPLCNIRQPVHRVRMVAPVTDLSERPAIQRLHHTAIFSGGGHRPVDPRTEPARMLPRRQGHHLHSPVHLHRPAAADDRMGHTLLPCMDHHPMDPAEQHGAMCRSVHRIQHRPHLQSI